MSSEGDLSVVAKEKESVANGVEDAGEEQTSAELPVKPDINDTIKSASDIPADFLPPGTGTINDESLAEEQPPKIDKEDDQQTPENQQQQQQQPVVENQPLTEEPVVEGNQPGVEGGNEQPVAAEPAPEKPAEIEWEDLLGNGQLMKRVLRKGGGISTCPTPQSRVKVRTRGVLDGGKVVDRHSGVVFTVGDGDVIPAWDLAVIIMERGETAQVKTNARFAYGEIGRTPDVPPNANIMYELELLEVMEPVNYKKISESDLLELVNKKRIRGNELFQRKEFDRAVEIYSKGLKTLDIFLEEQPPAPSAEPSPAIRDMQIRCWNNMAAAQLKVSCFKEALESCERVLQKEPDNVKALFRSGKVLALQGDMDRGIERLEKAASQRPEEKAIQSELQKAMAKRKTLEQAEKALYKRMMDGEKAKPQKKKTPPKPTPDTWGPLPYMAVAAVVATIGIGLAYILTQRH